MNRQFGLVLSGGGVRGVAHIGLLQALKEKGLKPDMISGSSAGALVGALYGSGFSTEEMVQFFKNAPLFEWSYISLAKPGFLDSEKYKGFFEDYFTSKTFEELSVDLFVMTTDLEKGASVVFDKGELIQPLIASASLPPVFSPVKINGRLFIDGGIMNNFPIEPLLGKTNFILGSYVNPISSVNNTYFTNSLRVTQRANELKFYGEFKNKSQLFDLVLEYQEMEGFGWLEKKKIDRIFEIGYQVGKDIVPDLIKELGKKHNSTGIHFDLHSSYSLN